MSPAESARGFAWNAGSEGSPITCDVRAIGVDRQNNVTLLTGRHKIGLLPNPVGEDRVFEDVELRNNTDVAIPLTGWFLRDSSGRVWALVSLVELPARGVSTIRRNGMAMSLDNGGDTVELLNEVGGVVHRVVYGTTAENVRVFP